EQVGRLKGDLGSSVLAMGTRLDLPAQEQRHSLHPVADTEHGYARLQQRGRRQRRTLVVDAVRAPGEDDGLVREDPVERGRGREYLGVDPRLADAASDQLRELRAVVDDRNLVHASIVSRGA